MDEPTGLPERPSGERMSRLPSWALAYVHTLEARVAYLHDEMTRDNEGSDTFAQTPLPLGMKGLPLGRGRRVLFQLGGDHEVEAFVNTDRRLTVRAKDGSLLVRPGAANQVGLQVEDF
jgi:hypothetical protein